MVDVATRFGREISPPLPRIFLPESYDSRILEAAHAVADAGIAHPVIDADVATRAARDHDIPLEQVELRNIDVSEYVDAYADLRTVSSSTARTLLDDEVVLGALMLRRDEVDAMVAGVTRASGKMLSIYNGLIGLRPGYQTASTAIIIETGQQVIGEDGALTYADCAMNVKPSSDRLADIAVSTARTVRELFGCTPHVAMLSFSTKGSSNHENARTVREAARMADDRLDDGCVEGELQLDAALVPEVRAQKLDEPSPCLENVNTLVFPNLDAANIAVKVSEYLAGMNMVGATLQGYAQPLGEISRGADAETIADLLTAVSLLAKRRQYPDGGEIIPEGRLRDRERELTR